MHIYGMHLTAHTDYALRILMFAAARHRLGPDHARFSVEDVAQAYGISRNHVMKIVQRLVGAGYLASFRGRGGGLSLKCAPDQVRIGALVRFLEQDLAIAACFGTTEGCRIGGLCALQRALGGAMEAFFDKLDAVTLKDLALPARTLAMLQAHIT